MTRPFEAPKLFNHPKLPPEIKERWLAKLRSGEYTQGNGVLRRRVDGVERNCCLGVLADVIDSKNWQLSPSGRAYLWRANAHTSIAICLRPATENAIAMTLQHTIAYFSDSHEYMNVEQFLIRCNDKWRWTFIDIANWVEENL